MATTTAPVASVASAALSYHHINDEREVDGPPEFFVDGVPCRSVFRGVDSVGQRLYVTYRVRCCSLSSSAAWREGC